jgi:hypothetical protein
MSVTDYDPDDWLPEHDYPPEMVAPDLCRGRDGPMLYVPDTDGEQVECPDEQCEGKDLWQRHGDSPAYDRSAT